MTGRPIVLELCSGEGGSTRGLMDAGWDVIAVDNDRNRLARNPARWKVHGDALVVLDELARTGVVVVVVDGTTVALRPVATWAGWPCQDYSRGTAAIRAQGRSTGYKRLIAVGREAQQATGLPYVIENVEDAGPEMRSPLLLCGRQFGLGAVDVDGTPLVLDRHRLFESDVLLMGAGHHPPHDSRVQVAGVYGGARTTLEGAKARGGGYTPKDERVQCDLLGIPVGSMTGLGRRLSIPPAYARFLGAQLLEALEVAA